MKGPQELTTSVLQALVELREKTDARIAGAVQRERQPVQRPVSRRVKFVITQVVIGSRSYLRHQRSRHISGRPFWIGAQVPAKARSSSSGVPQSCSPASALGDSKTATVER
jgi:hypothetical protein